MAANILVLLLDNLIKPEVWIRSPSPALWATSPPFGGEVIYEWLLHYLSPTRGRGRRIAPGEG
jgi:hypothetical protein